MIESLISGKVAIKPRLAPTKAGAEYVRLGVLVSQADGSEQYVSVVCFDEQGVQSLKRLTKGESVSVVGKTTISTYEAKDGTTKASVSLLATKTLTVYQARQARKPTPSVESTRKAVDATLAAHAPPHAMVDLGDFE